MAQHCYLVPEQIISQNSSLAIKAVHNIVKSGFKDKCDRDFATGKYSVIERYNMIYGTPMLTYKVNKKHEKIHAFTYCYIHKDSKGRYTVPNLKDTSSPHQWVPYAKHKRKCNYPRAHVSNCQYYEEPFYKKYKTYLAPPNVTILDTYHVVPNYGVVDVTRGLVTFNGYRYNFSNSINKANRERSPTPNLARGAFERTKFYFLGTPKMEIPQQIEDLTPCPHGSDGLRIVSFNIHGGVPIFYNKVNIKDPTDKQICNKPTLEHVTNICRKNDIDLLMVQENSTDAKVKSYKLSNNPNLTIPGVPVNFNNALKPDKLYHRAVYNGINIYNLHLPIYEDEKKMSMEDRRQACLGELKPPPHIVMGDFNEEWKNIENTPFVKNNELTYLGDSTEKTTPFNRVDHILVNKKEVNIYNYGIIRWNISDHYMTYLEIA